MPDSDPRIDQSVQALDTPTVLVDLDVLERNVARMAAFAAEHNIALHPHARSHKTLGIAERQRSACAAGLSQRSANTAPPPVPPEDGLAALAIVEAAHRAAAEGKWVSVSR